MSAVLSAPSLLVRFAAAMDLLCRAVAASGPRHPDAPFALLAWVRLRRLLARFWALVASVQAGRLPSLRPTPGQAARPRPAGPAIRLPGGSGWLLRLAPALETRIGRTQMESLLGDPELAALLAQAPQAGRILRPLCHALRIELPPALRLPRRSRPQRRPPSGCTDAEAERGKAPPARAAWPRLPWWLSLPASPPLPTLKGPPPLPPPCRARTGPPGT